MTQRSPLYYFRTSPEIILLAVMHSWKVEEQGERGQPGPIGLTAATEMIGEVSSQVALPGRLQSDLTPVALGQPLMEAPCSEMARSQRRPLPVEF